MNDWRERTRRAAPYAVVVPPVAAVFLLDAWCIATLDRDPLLYGVLKMAPVLLVWLVLIRPVPRFAAAYAIACGAISFPALLFFLLFGLPCLTANQCL